MFKNKYRAAMSVALAFALVSAFALHSLADSKQTEKATREHLIARAGRLLSGAPIGRLTGTGHLTIDGDLAQSGATILTGSTIATGEDGYATIDLSALGRIELRPNTTIRLTMTENNVEVSLERVGAMVQTLPAGVTARCNSRSEHTRIGVTRGEVKVKSNGSDRTLAEGEVGTFEQTLEASAAGDAVFTADGVASQDKTVASTDQPASGSTSTPTVVAGGGMVTAGIGGVMVLAGTALAVTVGVMGGGGNNNSSSIPPRPSRIVP